MKELPTNILYKKKKVLCLMICFLFSLTGCKKANIDSIKNLNNGNIWVIGHAGSGFQTGRNPVPSNSGSSIKKAIEAYSADGVELDLQLSKDSVIVMFHDDLMDRLTECLGCISEKNFAEINQCKFRQDFAVNIFNEETVIDFENVLAKYSKNANRPRLFLDIKIFQSCNQNNSTYVELFARKVANIIYQYNYESSVYVLTSNILFVETIRKNDPLGKIQIFKEAGDTYEKSKATALEMKLNGIEIFNKDITKEQVQDAHNHNLWVIIFDTKDRKSVVSAVNKSPDGIETDNIPLLQQVLMTKE